MDSPLMSLPLVSGWAQECEDAEELLTALKSMPLFSEMAERLEAEASLSSEIERHYQTVRYEIFLFAQKRAPSHYPRWLIQFTSSMAHLATLPLFESEVEALISARSSARLRAFMRMVVQYANPPDELRLEDRDSAFEEWMGQW